MRHTGFQLHAGVANRPTRLTENACATRPSRTMLDRPRQGTKLKAGRLHLMQCLARSAHSSDPGAGPDPQTGRLSWLAVSRARPKHGLDLGLYWLVLTHRLTCVLTCARAKIAPPPYGGDHSTLLQLSVGLHALYLTLFIAHTCCRSSGLVGSCSQASRHGSGSLLLAPRREWAAGRRHFTLLDYATGPRQEGFCAPACRPSLSPGVHPQVSVGVENRRQNPGQSVGGPTYPQRSSCSNICDGHQTGTA